MKLTRTTKERAPKLEKTDYEVEYYSLPSIANYSNSYVPAIEVNIGIRNTYRKSIE